MVLIPWSSAQGVSLLKVPYRFTQWELTFAKDMKHDIHVQAGLRDSLSNFVSEMSIATSFVAICQLRNEQATFPPQSAQPFSNPLQQKLLT